MSTGRAAGTEQLNYCRGRLKSALGRVLGYPLKPRSDMASEGSSKKKDRKTSLVDLELSTTLGKDGISCAFSFASDTGALAIRTVYLLSLNYSSHLGSFHILQVRAPLVGFCFARISERQSIMPSKS